MQTNSKRFSKHYAVRMIAGLSAYAIALFATHRCNTLFSPDKRWCLFLLPVIPIIYIVATIVGFVSEELDELQKKIVTEAAAFSGIATGFSCISYLFFQDAGAPSFRADWGFYMMCIYYGIGLFISKRRYK